MDIFLPVGADEEFAVVAGGDDAEGPAAGIPEAADVLAGGVVAVDGGVHADGPARAGRIEALAVDLADVDEEVPAAVGAEVGRDEVAGEALGDGVVVEAGESAGLPQQVGRGQRPVCRHRGADIAPEPVHAAAGQEGGDRGVVGEVVPLPETESPDVEQRPRGEVEHAAGALPEGMGPLVHGEEELVGADRLAGVETGELRGGIVAGKGRVDEGQDGINAGLEGLGGEVAGVGAELDGIDAALGVAGDFIVLAVAGPGLAG